MYNYISWNFEKFFFATVKFFLTMKVNPSEINQHSLTSSASKVNIFNKFDSFLNLVKTLTKTLKIDLIFNNFHVNINLLDGDFLYFDKFKELNLKYNLKLY